MPSKNHFYKHPSSIVDKTAAIGKSTKIWHFCHIMGGAQIGDACSLGQNVFVSSQVKIGNRVKIQNNVSLYDGVTLEDDVFCGPSCVFTNVKTPRSHVSRRGEYALTLVGQGATIGANATIVCGVKIGKHAFVGAGSCVTRDVLDNALVYGVPAKLRGWVCDCGEILKFRSKEGSCKRCGSKYELKKKGLIRLNERTIS